MTALRYEEVRALARLYFHWESGRTVPVYREMQQYVEEPHVPEDKARAILAGLIEKDLLELKGEGEPDLRQIQITSEGIAWFERNVDYWRDCNRYRFSPTNTTAPPEAGVPKSVVARLRDPLVPGAAAFGAAAATLLTWWFL